MLEYAPRGLVGVLTPQANTTVEPEFALLWPPGIAALTARMTAEGDSIEERLQGYVAALDAWPDRFGAAPIGAYAFATTGASYLIGPDAEDAAIARIEAARGRPFVTTARAVCDALGALGARRIGLVSPYPPALTEAGVGYWRARGFEIAAVADAYRGDDAFHPIYAMAGGRAAAALAELDGVPVDAALLLGTGMPTLAALAQAAGRDGPPVLSCMLALAWRTQAALEGVDADAASLAPWIAARDWGPRYAAWLRAIPAPAAARG